MATLHSTNSDSARVRSAFSRFPSNESGATAIEYSLVATLIVMVVVAALTNIGSSLIAMFEPIIPALK